MSRTARLQRYALVALTVVIIVTLWSEPCKFGAELFFDERHVSARSCACRLNWESSVHWQYSFVCLFKPQDGWCLSILFEAVDLFTLLKPPFRRAVA